MLFAFGGAYLWTYPVATAAIVVAALVTRPRVAAAGSRCLDVALLLCLACAAFQIVALPLAWRHALSPHAEVVDRALRLDAGLVPRRSLSLDPSATLKGGAVAAMVTLLFWVARETFAQGGVRRVARTVAWAGLVVSVAAIICLAIAPRLIYATWSVGADANPYGPFINRNHMGTWLVMAAPLVVGYLVARVEHHAARSRSALVVDAMTLWLAGAASAIVAALIVSLSRSAVIGAAAAGLCGGAIAASRRGRKAAWWLMGAAALSLAIAVSMPRTLELVMKFEDSRTTATWARPQIWRETIPIVRDFAATGVGLGAYRTAMLVYQQSDRKFFFNQAHNQYLQLAAEGGVLLLAPLAVGAAAFASGVTRRMRADRSAVFWIRAGAVAGIAGVLVQSFWETGLRLPANGLLFAVLCAIAVHDRDQSEPRRGAAA